VSSRCPLPASTRGPLRIATFAALLSFATSSHAAPDDAARRAQVAVRVGAFTVTVGELEDRLASVPPFQAATFGATPDEIVHAYVDQVVVRELLLGSGADARKLENGLPTKHQLQRAKSTATLRALRGSFKSPAAIADADVTKYFEDNRARFEAPERVNLWRILCKTREEAESVQSEAKRDLTIPKWNDLARDHSIDQATKFRGGNLGFIASDGTSNQAGVKVDPVLFHAASSVKDGELAGPIAEAGAFAVVWRRTTVPATKRTLDEVSQQIRTSIFRERTEAAEKKLIDDLRAKKVRDVDADLLKIIEIPPVDASVTLPRSVPSPPSAR
jgi:peptidyl-prolyl cis-trans isomerase C